MTVPEYWEDWLEKFYDKVKYSEFLYTDYSFIQNEDVKKTAVIIEPRKHPLLKYVLYNFMYFLIPKGWRFQIYCGTDNKEWIEEEVFTVKDKRSIYYQMKLKNIEVTSLPYDNMNEIMYNMLLTNAGFWKTIIDSPKHVLIFQTDCILLKDNIDEFLEFDMIGAPWRHSPYKGCNGGFSLRNRESMLNICKSRDYRYENEDGWFSFTNSDKLKMPELKDKLQFSMETIWSNKPTGMHAPYKHQDGNMLKQLLEKSFENIFK